MIISIDAEKAFNKIQYPLMIKKKKEKKKKLQKIVIEWTCHHIIKIIYDKSTENFILNGENLKAFSLDQEQDNGAHSQHYYSIWVLEVLVLAMRKEKKTKDLYFENYKTLM